MDVGKPEVSAQVGPSGDYLRLARDPGTIQEPSALLLHAKEAASEVRNGKCPKSLVDKVHTEVLGVLCLTSREVRDIVLLLV